MLRLFVMIYRPADTRSAKSRRCLLSVKSADCEGYQTGVAMLRNEAARITAPRHSTVTWVRSRTAVMIPQRGKRGGSERRWQLMRSWEPC